MGMVTQQWPDAPAERGPYTITHAQLVDYYRSIVSMCADECDRADLQVGGEPYRLRRLKHDPAGHGPMATRVLAMRDCEPPVLPGGWNT